MLPTISEIVEVGLSILSTFKYEKKRRIEQQINNLYLKQEDIWYKDQNKSRNM